MVACEGADRDDGDELRGEVKATEGRLLTAISHAAGVTLESFGSPAPRGEVELTRRAFTPA